MRKFMDKEMTNKEKLERINSRKSQTDFYIEELYGQLESIEAKNQKLLRVLELYKKSHKCPTAFTCSLCRTVLLEEK